jgi:tetratricopeptide (TPR) repeat protein
MILSDWASVPLSLALLAFALNASPAHAAPFTPAKDSDVVERLPLASDASARQLESLRRQLVGRPDDNALRLDIGRRYFTLAMAQGDPRLVGYAAAAIAPLATKSGDTADYWLLRGQLEQFSHQFEPALASLAKASQLNPKSAEPLAWRAAIFMVQARYTEAKTECERVAAVSEPLFATGCRAYVQAATGELKPAFDAMDSAIKTAVATKPPPAPELLLWAYTRQAEMAIRLQQNEVAENLFKSALKLGVTDQFLLGAYADFLLAQQRPAEVLKLLAGWERSDILLLRMAMAGQATKDSNATDWTSQLRDRFQAAAQRGDRLHEQEAARFELDLERNPTKALAAASSNYTVQKEPRDAEILMRTAIAAKQPKAAQPALNWLRTSRYEDPVFDKLAAQLAAQGATR